MNDDGRETMNLPVLIAGAGPVGMTLAMSLARQGVPVRIVDENAARTDKSKALVIWPRTLELLAIQGCEASFIAAGTQGHGLRLVANGEPLIHVTLDVIDSAYRFALLIPQSETERLLEEELASLGVAVERTTTLTSFTDQGDRVSASLRHADGRTESVDVAYLAGCDGAHSIVRHGLAMPFEGDTTPWDWVLGDFHIDGAIASDEITMCWTQEGILALFPMGGTRFRLIADNGLASADAGPPPTLAELQSLLDARGPKGLRGHDAVWLSRFRINERKVKEYQRGRVFLAGDAAHIHSPAGGQGMNTGMQDAFNLAWKMALVYRGLAAGSLLDSYTIERSAIGDQVLRDTARLTEVAMVRNPWLQEVRNLVASTLMGHVAAIRQRMVDALSEVDLHYPHSPLTRSPHGAARRPAGGERAVDVPLDTTAPSPVRLNDILGRGCFAVLSVGVAPVAVPATLATLAVAAHCEAHPAYDPGHAYLIRPDGYVALGTDGVHNEPIFALLQSLRTGG